MLNKINVKYKILIQLKKHSKYINIKIKIYHKYYDAILPPPPRALDRRLKKIGSEMQENILGFS